MVTGEVMSDREIIFLLIGLNIGFASAWMAIGVVWGWHRALLLLAETIRRIERK